MEIEELRDIVRVIRNNSNLASLPLDFRKLFNQESKLADFYQILLDSDVRSDEEAIAKLYDKENSSNNYKSLKSYFISRAINNISFFDLSKSDKSDHIKALYKCYKYLFTVRVLLALGSRSGAIGLAKKTLSLAEKFELHTVAIDLLGALMTDALQLGARKDYSRFLALSAKRTNLLANEAKIVALQQQIRINFSKSLFVPDQLKTDVRSAVNEAKTLLAKGDTYFGRISYYRLLYVFYQVEGEPLKSANACDEAIQYMLGKPHMSPPSRLAEFALYKLENYILLRDYENGKLAAAYCEEHINKGMNLWFSFKEYEFLLMMQTLKFLEADKIYLEVRTHERFESLSAHLKERWQIFGLHIQYVMRSHFLKSSNSPPPSFRKSYLMRNREFKGRLIDFPTYRKDKRGFNVAILTLNILVALEENKRDILLQQEEALSSYRFKYLNVKHSRQSYILFKLIRLVIKNEFHFDQIQEKASEIEKELDLRELEAGEIFECIQILPPQWVWNRIKAILANRK